MLASVILLFHGSLTAGWCPDSSSGVFRFLFLRPRLLPRRHSIYSVLLGFTRFVQLSVLLLGISQSSVWEESEREFTLKRTSIVTYADETWMNKIKLNNLRPSRPTFPTKFLHPKRNERWEYKKIIAFHPIQIGVGSVRNGSNLVTNRWNAICKLSTRTKRTRYTHFGRLGPRRFFLFETEKARYFGYFRKLTRLTKNKSPSVTTCI